MKKYTKRLSIFSLVVLMLWGTAGASFAFRCGTSLVSEGDTRAVVTYKCGDPDYFDSWEEERFSRDFRVERGYDPRGRS